MMFLLLMRHAASAATPVEPVPDQHLVLEVYLNGASTHEVDEFLLRADVLYAKPEDLRVLRIRIPSTAAPASDGFLSLASVPGVQWKVDRSKQLLYLTLSPTLLALTQLGGFHADEKRTLLSSNGLTLNYDMFGNYAGGTVYGSGSFDLRGFTPHGIFASDWLTYGGGSGSASLPANRAVRLDTSFAHLDVNSLHTYVLGDFITSSLVWTRPVRFEGVQFRRDFSTRPDLITFPRPGISGTAAVDSTVSVLVNGSQVNNTQINAGPFQIQQLPVVNGAGEITLNVVDAQGVQQTVTQPFYASNTMLATGLQTYSAQAGLVRRNWGTESYREGKLAGSAVFRRGIADHFTVEASTEATPGAYNGGVGGLFLLRHYALFNAAIAGSDNTAGAPGVQVSTGLQRLARRYSFGVQVILANANYRDIAAVNGTGVQRKLMTAFGGVSIKHLGNLNAAYAIQDQDPSPVVFGGDVGSVGSFAVPLHNRLLTASYNRSFGRISFLATVLRTFNGVGNGTSDSTQAQFGLTIPFHRRDNVTLGGTTDGSAQIQVQQPAIIIGDFGFEGYVSADGDKHEFAEVQYKSRFGLNTVGIDVLNGSATVRAESQGALNIIDRGVFASNYVYNSFALVDTAPVSHVHVLFENRNIGTTDHSGRLLVPDLNAYILNKLSVRATDIPVDATITTTEFELRPQERSGIVVRFPLEFTRSAVLLLVDGNGKPLPVGSVAVLDATHVETPVGFGGETYVEHLGPYNTVTVKLDDEKTCTVAFNYARLSGDIPTIGPLNCVEKKP